MKDKWKNYEVGQQVKCVYRRSGDFGKVGTIEGFKEDNFGGVACVRVGDHVSKYREVNSLEPLAPTPRPLQVGDRVRVGDVIGIEGRHGYVAKWTADLCGSHPKADWYHVALDGEAELGRLFSSDNLTRIDDEPAVEGPCPTCNDTGTVDCMCCTSTPGGQPHCPGHDCPTCVPDGDFPDFLDAADFEKGATARVIPDPEPAKALEPSWDGQRYVKERKIVGVYDRERSEKSMSAQDEYRRIQTDEYERQNHGAIFGYYEGPGDPPCPLASLADFNPRKWAGRNHMTLGEKSEHWDGNE
jgi:hypothetical protein